MHDNRNISKMIRSGKISCYGLCNKVKRATIEVNIDKDVTNLRLGEIFGTSKILFISHSQWNNVLINNVMIEFQM